MEQKISPKDRDRFRKIILVMKSATIDGERDAASMAATRMAAQWDMTLEEAIEETHPEIYGDRYAERERTARRQSAYEAWETGTMRMMRNKEAQEKYAFEQAKRQARQRGLDEREKNAANSNAKPRARNFHSNAKVSPTDTFRLITVLLKDGLPLRRVAELADVSTNEVARVYLLNREA
ncbi:hypothetical protein [Aestuariispira insulae]|uniref:DUF2786 domain-containing protein n=1 Tax=Aestuariispira insulae TaxID=1461337 RepID=A0A3D9HX26_9PROT|nr:hypothetical protein [Aestuariispira insulae]RED54044.1 hypothetical protein DFP90_101845 [Aestuariispira insulae]